MTDIKQHPVLKEAQEMAGKAMNKILVHELPKGLLPDPACDVSTQHALEKAAEEAVKHGGYAPVPPEMSETKQCSVCHCPLAPLDDNGYSTHRYPHMCFDLLNAEVNRLKKENAALDELKDERSRLRVALDEGHCYRIRAESKLLKVRAVAERLKEEATKEDLVYGRTDKCISCRSDHKREAARMIEEALK